MHIIIAAPRHLVLFLNPTFPLSSPGAPLQKHEVTLNLRSGIEAKDYDALKEKENLQPLELELRRMEELAEEYVSRGCYGDEGCGHWLT